MSAYATTTELQARMLRTLGTDELALAATLLEDAAVLIDAYNSSASADAKKIVSCRVVARILGDGSTDIPLGATQGSMSAMGYSQSWTLGSGAAGEMYLGKTDKKLLGVCGQIGSYSPVEELAESEDES